MLTHLKHNWLIIVIGIVVIFVLLIISKDDADHLDANMDTMAPVAENEDDTHNVDQETGDSIVVVDVKGEVHDPGVYEVSEADRIQKLHKHLDHELRSEEHTSELQSRGHLVCRL